MCPAVMRWRKERREMAKYEIRFDFENNSEEFYDALRDTVGSFAEPVRELFENDSIVVDAEQRDQLMSHFRRLPGWNGGPSHAPHPLIVRESED